MTILNAVFAAIFVGLIIYAMISDALRLLIPNIIPLGLIAAFAVYALLGGIGAVWPHIIVGGAVFLVMFVLFAIGGFSAGDVKLIGAVALWAGPSHAPLFVVLFSLLGAALAVGLLAFRQVQKHYPVIAEVPALSKVSRMASKKLCPYAIPIGIAALVVAPSIFHLR